MLVTSYTTLIVRVRIFRAGEARPGKSRTRREKGEAFFAHNNIMNDIILFIKTSIANIDLAISSYISAKGGRLDDQYDSVLESESQSPNQSQIQKQSQNQRENQTNVQSKTMNLEDSSKKLIDIQNQLKDINLNIDHITTEFEKTQSRIQIQMNMIEKYKEIQTAYLSSLNEFKTIQETSDKYLTKCECRINVQEHRIADIRNRLHVYLKNEQELDEKIDFDDTLGTWHLAPHN